MGAYALRRLLWLPFTVMLTSMLVFLLVRFLPGTVVDDIVAEMQSSAGDTAVARAAIEHALGLDVPVYVQYGRWVSNIVLHGSLGKSLNGSRDIAKEIENRLPVTFELGLMSLIISVLISIPIGILASIRQDTIQDYILRSISIVCISVPTFWLGTMIMIYPSIWWNWSPPMELIPFVKDPIGNLGMFLLPSLVLGITMTGNSMRMTRTMMLEVLRQDYIRTAWSKGLRERVVVIRHTLKNALIPVVTIIGLQLPGLVGGAVIIEQIFVLPGMGRLLIQSLAQRDYPIVSGITLVLSAFVIIVNLFIDLTYGWMDPRVHYQ